jgi:hypothetical protein
MDISQINDKKELKSLGWDQMTIIEKAQEVLRAINKQLSKLDEEESYNNRTHPDNTNN